MNDKQSAVTNDRQELGLTPPLRFQEFCGAEKWRASQLGQIANFSSGGTPSKSTPGYWNGSIPWISASSMYDIYIDDSELRITELAVSHGASIAKKGSLLILVRGSMLFNRVPMGIAAVDVAFNQDVKALTLVPNVDTQFVLYQLLATESKISIDKTGIGAGKIDTDDLKRIAVYLPSIKEQRKVADCLSSVNELIAAEGRKLSSFKAHKKGLLEQLFPAKGETIPRLRFPEFQNAGEWKQSTLGALGKLVPGLTYRPDDVREDGLLVLRSSNIRQGKIALEDCVYVNPSVKGAHLSRPSDILICVRNGSTSLIGKNALIPKAMPLCTHGAFMTVFRSHSSGFVFQMLQTSQYQKQVDADLGATINSINGSQLIRFKFLVPESLEQQRIAAFLSSIDEVTAAQTDRIAALKAHKKALMQQLFPDLDEVQA